MGTPAYMSPEQAAGSRELDGRSDLYSLGCVLYEMLAGQAPFTGPTAESVVYQHLTAEPPRITGMRPAVPAHVAATLERALAKTPADRFNPVALFAEALAPGTLASVAPAAAPPRGPVARWPWERIALAGVAAVVVLAGAAAVGRWMSPGPAEPGAEGLAARTAMAVLPFQNLSAEGPHSYFAGGLHDELLTQLSKVAALSLRGRTSVMGYAGTTKSIPQIAEELSVGSIVEGSVQVVANRLRVNVQLIDASTDEHLWAESYDRTLDDAFAIQSDIARRIVEAVGATLTGPEAVAMASASTDNPEAYRLYLQGLEYYRRSGYQRRNLEIAQDLYERALALDSTFALGHAALSDVHGRISWFRYDPSPERLVWQREAAEAALRMEPDLPQAHWAMGNYHYQGRRDWDAALEQYRIALEKLPNDAELWARIGFTHRRRGEWDEVLAVFDRAVALDPRNADVLGDLGGATLSQLRRYDEAVKLYSRALELAPDAAVFEVLPRLFHGQMDSLKAVLDRHPLEADFGFKGSAAGLRALTLLWEREADSLLLLLQRFDQTVFSSNSFYHPTALYAAWAHVLLGDDAAAEGAFASALALLDSVMAVIPEDWRVHSARGMALAGLRRNREAEAEARWLQQSQVYREDAHEGPGLAEDRARILAGIGQTEAALQEIERLLAGPSMLSVHTLRLDPRFDPIRHDPRFQALLVKYANPEAGG